MHSGSRFAQAVPSRSAKLLRLQATIPAELSAAHICRRCALIPLLPFLRCTQVEGQEDEPVGPSFFWRTIEDDLGTIAQYYDAPVLSLRNAVYHLLREGRPGFQVRCLGQHT